MPRNPATGHLAKCNDPATWTSFDKAVQTFADRLGGPRQYDGISFVFSDADPYVGFDFDDAVAGDTISEPVRAILRRLNGYAEVSPSGNGVKCWVRGKLPTTGTGRKTNEVQGYGALEAYQRGRFFTVTGRKVESHEL